MAKAPTKKTAEPDWALPPVNDKGQQLAEDGLPLTGLARALALAEAGTKSDPLALVTDEQIAAHDLKGQAADLEAFVASQETEDGAVPDFTPSEPTTPAAPTGDGPTTASGE